MKKIRSISRDVTNSALEPVYVLIENLNTTVSNDVSALESLVSTVGDLATKIGYLETSVYSIPSISTDPIQYDISDLGDVDIVHVESAYWSVVGVEYDGSALVEDTDYSYGSSTVTLSDTELLSGIFTEAEQTATFTFTFENSVTGDLYNLDVDVVSVETEPTP